MSDLPPPRDPGLQFLKWLVIALTATLLAGFVVLVFLFATRFPNPQAPLPAAITLPDGATARAVTRGTDWIAVVTDADEILIYAPDGETIRQRIAIE
ncbi:DUF6476 family protein [Palleronia aestuarii]|nr:DUF6476 family protein [Palleronia aestuarii]